MERLTDKPAILGEGPCWHQEEQVLYWVDILGKQLHRFDPDTGEDRQFEMGQLIGTVTPRAAGGLVVALENGLALFDPTTSSLEPWPDIDTNPETRFNDGKCDPSGRLWVGTMDLVQESRPLGSLYRVDADRSVHRIEDQITISNGITWSPDRQTMYYIDSPTKTIVAYDYDDGSGNVTNRRVVIRLDDEQGWPDGMTIDAEGMIWLAHWGGSRVCRWDPTSGQVLETHPTPAPHTSACCFGGPDLSDLYVTTARKGLSEEQLEQYPESGHLFRLMTSVQGSATFAFAGSAFGDFFGVR